MLNSQEEYSSNSYMACAEPTWARSIPEKQLIGLLNLSCLLTSSVRFSDVHLGDNPNFYSSYLSGKHNSLYDRLRAFSKLGLVKVLLRDSLYRPRAKIVEYKVENFSDVYDSWVKHNTMDAWICQEISEDRRQYFKHLDSWVLDATLRYNYQEIKSKFIEKVRIAFQSGPESWFRKPIEKLHPTLQRHYFDLIYSDWFSLSDIYSLFQSHGVSNSHDVMLYHGLLNELTYNNSVSSLLLGIDKDTRPVESIFWGEIDELTSKSKSEVGAILNEILERAYTILDAPSLSILALLPPEEIMNLRQAGQSYFDLLELSQDPLYVKDQKDFTNRFVQAMVDYWRAIIEHLRRSRQATQSQTKLAIFMGELPGPFAKIATSSFCFGLNVGKNLVSRVTQYKTVVEGLEELSKNVSMRFLFWGDRNELKKIKSVIPNRIWFTKSHPDPLKK